MKIKVDKIIFPGYKKRAMLLCLSYITSTDSTYSLLLPFFFYQKSVEQKQNMSFVPILAINFGSHRINNCVNIFPSRDYTSCVLCVYWRTTLTLLTRIMPYPHSCYTTLFSFKKPAFLIDTNNIKNVGISKNHCVK